MPPDDLAAWWRPHAAAYDLAAETYGTRRQTRFDHFLEDEVCVFAAAVKPVGRSVVDLGSGPGHESDLLASHGLRPVCVDASQQMAVRCRQRGFPAVRSDFMRLGLAPARFAGVWAAFSLLHLPKALLPAAVAEAASHLRYGGYLHVSLFEGDGEELRGPRDDRLGMPRYFAYYRLPELEAVIGQTLEVTGSWRLENTPRPTIAVLARRNVIVTGA